MTTTSVYLAHSHAWVHDRLLTGAVIERADVALVESPAEADMIVLPRPPVRDPEARDSLVGLRRSERLKVFAYAQMDEPFPWLPGVYAGLDAGRASRATVGGAYLAHHHLESGLAEEIEAARELEPDLLWSFMGTLRNHPVRASLATLDDDRGLVRDTREWHERIRWQWGSTGRDEASAAFEAFATLMGRSAFVLCPRGRGASSIRLFEAMQAGRCPVIVSDEWLPPPLVDWGSCSIRVAESQVGELPAILRAREGEATELGRAARAVWERRFAPERQLETLISTLLTIPDSPSVRAATAFRAVARPDLPRRLGRSAKKRLGR